MYLRVVKCCYGNVHFVLLLWDIMHLFGQDLVSVRMHLFKYLI